MMHSRPPAWIVGLWFVNITIWTRTIGEGGTMSANKHFQVSNEETRHPGPGPGPAQLLTRTAPLPAQASHNL